jgi:serine/threonine-protein kinase
MITQLVVSGTAALVVLASLTTNISSAIARESIAINSIVISGVDSSGTVFASFSVPDRSNDRAFFNSELSLYDLHIAKMYEVTDALCDRRLTFPFSQNIQTFQWSYSANSFPIGQLQISCREAEDVINTYGRAFLSESTPIRRPLSPDAPPSSEILQIPTLNLAGYQVPLWKSFTRRLRLSGNY